MKGSSETIKNDVKEQKDGFVPILLGTLTATISGNTLTGKTVTKAGQNFWCCLILYLVLKYQNIIKMNLNLMAFAQEIIFLKWKMGHIW